MNCICVKFVSSVREGVAGKMWISGIRKPTTICACHSVQTSSDIAGSCLSHCTSLQDIVFDS